jgi:hypothetical protein
MKKSKNVIKLVSLLRKIATGVGQADTVITIDI